MNREVHVRIWERPEVRVLRATRRVSRAPQELAAARNCTRDEGGPFEMLRAVNGSSVARRPASSLAIVEHIFG